ncbi:MAG: hypothetical protein IJ583_04430, partial [Firmicutes bacterium]|nr:hypothetical protein [Bacillota bacterium]
MNIKKIVRIIICSVLIFQILISSLSNDYAIAPAIPIYLADAIAQVAIANGVRLGEENKGDIAGELYNNMTPEQREILRRDCLIYVDSLTFSPLAYYQMSKPCFEMLSKEISEYFNDKIADGTYSIETEEVAPSYGETVYIKASDTQTFLDTINATLPEGCNKVTASSSLLSYYRDYLNKYSDIYVGYCSAMTNVTSSNLNNVYRYPGFYVCGGDLDTFLSTL